MLDNKIHRIRIRVVIGVVVAAGVLVIVRLFTLQIVHKSLYQARAERQYITPTGSIFDRGNIYFTSKDGSTVAAATVETGFKMAITPSQIITPEKTYEALAPFLSLDKNAFIAATEKKNDPYQEIAQKITPEQADTIAALKIPGISLYRDKWRFYPGGALASKAIGFVSYRNNALVGNYGLESYYNDVLSRSSDNFYVNFFAEIFANVRSTIFKNSAATGDVITSIEPTVQAQLESVIAGVQDKWSSDAAGGVIMDPTTGEILAIAAVPTFDANTFGAVKDIGVYTNPLAQNDYEMGSIVKPLVMAGAIDSGAVTPETVYTDLGSVTIANKTISNFDKKARGRATMQTVLNQSLNTGMVFVEGKMGKDAFKEYMLNHYRIGEKTGVDLPGEIKGLVSNLRTSNDVDYATAAFGQGIATTPLNIVRSYAALANGGYLVTPHLAKTINQSDGSVKTLSYPKSDAILKPETIATIKAMLTTVVDEGYHRGLPHYTVAAKTGTAQIARPGGGGYYTDRNLHSLIGFFPVSNPRFVLYLFNYYPKNVNFAAQTLADPFFGMVQFLTNYYEITPDR